MNESAARTLRILGTRGVPAAHGGFETFAEYLSLYLVQRGWRVVVYCQEEGSGPAFIDEWRGVQRLHIPVRQTGPAGTILFDWRATFHASGQGREDGGLCLTLGYNTAVFCSLLRLRGVKNVINMDGIEWARAKWSRMARFWFWLNDWAGCWLGDHLVADHPEIKVHLSSRVSPGKITTIAYGAERLENVSDAPVRSMGLVPGAYLSLIARAEPENSILEVVRGFSKRPRGVTLVILGEYSSQNAYHRAVKAAASDEVLFVGAIYDKEVVQSLRFHSLAYVHGHQVGGTNPSLVEALGAGNAVIAHDNRFNRWVVGDGALYFRGEEEFAERLQSLLSNPATAKHLRVAAKQRFEEGLTWPIILDKYDSLLLEHYKK